MPKPRTNFEHVQAIREGKDYYSPRLAINETIDHLVDCALVFKNHDQVPSTEARVLDAIGVQVCRELKNRAEMIYALTDRLQAVEAELKAKATRVGELEQALRNPGSRAAELVQRDNDPGPQEGRRIRHIAPELANAQFSG
jgi:hypothetical protein